MILTESLGWNLWVGKVNQWVGAEDETSWPDHKSKFNRLNSELSVNPYILNGDAHDYKKKSHESQ